MNTQSTVRLVIVGLVAGLVLGVLGIIVLAALERSVPDVLSNVTVGVLGALAAMLARTGDTDVRVVNDEADPVPVVADDRGQSVLGIAVLALVVACVALALILL